MENVTVLEYCGNDVLETVAPVAKPVVATVEKPVEPIVYEHIIPVFNDNGTRIDKTANIVRKILKSRLKVSHGLGLVTRDNVVITVTDTSSATDKSKRTVDENDVDDIAQEAFILYISAWRNGKEISIASACGFAVKNHNRKDRRKVGKKRKNASGKMEVNPLYKYVRTDTKPVKVSTVTRTLADVPVTGKAKQALAMLATGARSNHVATALGISKSHFSESIMPVIRAAVTDENNVCKGNGNGTLFVDTDYNTTTMLPAQRIDKSYRGRITRFNVGIEPRLLVAGNSSLADYSAFVAPAHVQPLTQPFSSRLLSLPLCSAEDRHIDVSRTQRGTIVNVTETGFKTDNDGVFHPPVTTVVSSSKSNVVRPVVMRDRDGKVYGEVITYFRKPGTLKPVKKDAISFVSHERISIVTGLPVMNESAYHSIALTRGLPRLPYVHQDNGSGI